MIFLTGMGMGMISPTQIDPLPSLSPVQSLSGFHADIKLVRVIIQKLYQWQILLPVTLKIHNTQPHPILQHLVHPFRLTIGVHVVCLAETQLPPHLHMKSLREMGHKDLIPNRKYVERHPVQSHYLCYEKLHVLPCRIIHLNW